MQHSAREGRSEQMSWIERTKRAAQSADGRVDKARKSRAEEPRGLQSTKELSDRMSVERIRRARARCPGSAAGSQAAMHGDLMCTWW